MVKTNLGYFGYLFSFSWGICILLAFTGWGALINRLLFPRDRIDWGQRAAWGLALATVIGGLLNISSRISRPTVLVWVGCGVLVFAADLLTGWGSLVARVSARIRELESKPWLIAAALLVCLLTTIHYSGSVATGFRQTSNYTSGFNLHDDLKAYMVYPVKMLQTGALGLDPFSERRINASLGGQYFLQTLVLAALPEYGLRLIDPGLGVVLVLGLLIGYVSEQRLALNRALSVLLFFLLLYFPILNITSLLTGMALFVSLFRTLAWKELQNYNLATRALIVALVAAGICSLKSSLIPACVILFISSYLYYAVASLRRRDAIWEFVISSLLVVLFLLPWMLAMYQSSGTLLYPILGRGYHGSAYGEFRIPFGNYSLSDHLELFVSTLTSVPFIALAMLGVLRSSFRLNPGGRGALASILFAALVGDLVITFVMAGYDTVRFTFPFVSAAALVVTASVLAPKESGGGSAGWVAGAALAAGLYIGPGWDRTRYAYLGLIQGIQPRLGDLFAIPDQEMSQYRALQQRVPEGETILARLEKPFLLNFRRNRIYIVDSPGGASLPPGMPCFRGAAALADYLASKSIRFVTYSYATESAESRKIFGSFAGPSVQPWISALFKHAFDFQDNLAELGKTRRRIYDDGDIFVLDLSQRPD